jgi:hypothetical protein
VKASSDEEIERRYQHAMQLVQADKHDEAVDALVELWRYTIDRSRPVSRLAERELRALFARHAPARPAVARLRDAVAPPRRQLADPDALREWAALCDLLEEPARVLAWFDDTYCRLADPTPLAAMVDKLLVRPLMMAERWADAGRIIQDPVARIAAILPPRAPDHAERMAELPGEMRAKIEAMGSRGRCTFAAMFVRSLLAANRQADARAVADHCLSVDGSPAMAETIAREGVLPS